MTITGKKYVECTILGSGGSAEAEDSSYDSDYEAEEPGQAEGKLAAAAHSDVSRTASDTLAAEFAEYVTVHGALQNGIVAAPATYTPGYAARVEFGLKLGYTERLVQAALQKLGPEPGQNELLAELIKLGASAAPRLADPADETEALLPCPGEPEPAEPGGPEEAPGAGGYEPGALRPVVIDGSNVAMSHGNKEVFSCRGIKICVDWFRARGHREITVFVPKWRKEASRPDNPVAEQEILGELERDRLLVFTPSRLVGGKRMVCYDDRYILRLAAELDGIVVSNDNYRDLAQESPEFRKVVEERILMYSFVNDRFMPPDDPLGRSGPTLDNFLRVGPRRTEPAPPCPYAKKCTYGNKCKFRHPERGPHPHKSVTERLVEHAQRQLQARSPSLPLAGQPQHSSLAKTRSWTPGHDAAGPAAGQPKSRSVEDVAADSLHGQHGLTGAQSPQGYPSALGWVAPRMANPEPESANMHRKLQRQLTLNPSCDPRINQLRRYYQQHQQQQQQPPTGQPRSALQNRQLTRHASNDAAYPGCMSWEHQQLRQRGAVQQQQHQHVTRIASAPDSYRNCRPPGARASSSLLKPAAALLIPSAQQQQQQQRLGASEPQLELLGGRAWNAQDARRHLHYHLANIFPEEQVQAAMARHPRETDPQQICAAILAMFPKI